MISFLRSTLMCIVSLVMDISLFSRSNMMFFISPPPALATALYFSNRASVINLFRPCLSSFVYVYLFILQFNISNDITGVDADRIDKPRRPIPSNRITIERAWYLYCLMVFIFLVDSYVIGHLSASMSWVIITIILNFTPAHNSSIKKNAFLVPGTFVMISVVWCLMNHVSSVWDYSKVLWNFLFNSCIFGVILVQQDMRDVNGDIALGRRTFSIALGRLRAERMIAKICCVALFCLLVEACVIEQVRVVTKATYMLLNSILYGIMIVRNWFSFDSRKTYEYFFHITFFSYFVMIPLPDVD